MADKNGKEGYDSGGIPSGAMRRSMKLASLPMSFAGRAALGWGQKVTGRDADEVAMTMLERNAEQLFAVLGELKGGAMKLGQALSVYESMIPAEFAEPYQRALTQLQSQGPALPTATVRRVLDQQLGRNWTSHFQDFSDAPAAAASIGQVHRGIWQDGREVAVKIQYPGADLALQADLKQLQRMARLFNLVVPGLDAHALISEIRERMLEELDYRAEADHQRAFHAEFADSDVINVPAVVASAPKVIISEWIDGTPLSRLIREPKLPEGEAERDRIAAITLELLYSSPARVGLLHADPHPGNFLIQPDGRIGVIDFGAVAVLPDGLPTVLGEITRYAANNDPDELIALLRKERFVTGDVPPADVLRWLGGLVDPVREEKFHFHRAWLSRQGERVVNPYSNAYLKTGRALNLPAEHMLVLRVTGGWTNILAQLDCTVAAREIALRWVPGFAEPSA